MHIWVICDNEPLPTDPGNPRLMRTGMLTTALVEAGHQVTWFASSFDHYRKRQRDLPPEVSVPGLNVQMLRTAGYTSNVSAARVLHNIAFSRTFARLAASLEPPDALIVTVPTTEAAAAAVRFGNTHAVPSILDVHDLWPDSFPRFIPPLLYALSLPAIAVMDRQLRYACRNASSLIGISQSYLQWAQAKGTRGERRRDDRVFRLSYQPRPVTDGPGVERLLSRLDIAGDAPLVSFVGSWGVTTDLSLVADAARQLSDTGAQFVIAGDSSAAPTMRDQLQAIPNVRLSGWLDADEIGMLLSVSDVGLLPYRERAPQDLPNKVFEYMAYGVFQIGTLQGGAEEMYRRTGVGRSVACSGSAIAEAISVHLSRAEERQARLARIDTFRTEVPGHAVYQNIVRHVENIVNGFRRSDRT